MIPALRLSLMGLSVPASLQAGGSRSIHSNS